jgi:hypothetical protein
MWTTPGMGVLGRQGFFVRECSTPSENELVAGVTRSHPASLCAGVRTTNIFLKPDVKPKCPF